MTRDLRLFYAFRLLATSYLYVPIFMFFLASRGFGFYPAMILGAVYAGVVILVEIPTGALADRIGRRKSMMAGSLAMVAACLTAYSAHTFGVFLIAEVLAAVSIALCSGADSAYLFDLLKDNGQGHDYPRREGTASAWHLVGSGAACIGGGFLAEVDLALPYLVTAGVAGLAFVIALCMRSEYSGVGRLAGRKTIGQELGAYLRLMATSVGEVRRNTRLIWIVFYSSVAFVLLAAMLYLLQPFLKSRGFQFWQVGIVYAGINFVAALSAHYANTLRRVLGEELLVWTLLAVLALSFLLLNQFSGQWVLGLLLVYSVSKGLYSPLVKPILNRQVTDSGRRATVLSIESIARRGSMSAFSVTAGLFGAASALYLAGAVGLGGLLLLAVASQHGPGRNTPSAPVIESAPQAVVSPDSTR